MAESSHDAPTISELLDKMEQIQIDLATFRRGLEKYEACNSPSEVRSLAPGNNSPEQLRFRLGIQRKP